MVARDDLFLLIHSLSKTEKRYFKINVNHKSDKGNNYIRLFDLINKMEDYDETIIHQKFKGEKLLKNLPKEKNYLYQAILKSLRAYRKDKSSQIQIREFMTDADFLRERSLFPQSLRLLGKAKQLAYKFDNYLALLEILEQERELFRVLYHKEGINQLDSLIRETREILENLNRKFDYQELYDHFFLKTLMSKESLLSPDLVSIKAEKLLDSETPPKTFHDTHRYYSILAMKSRLSGDKAKAWKYNKAIVDLWTANSHFKLEQQYVYRNLLSNLLNSCFAIGAYELVPDIIAELKQIPSKNQHDAGTAFKHVYHAELMYYMNTGNFEVAKELVPEIQTGIEVHKKSIGESRMQTFIGNIAILYFILEEQETALQWLDQIIGTSKKQPRQDIRRFARTLQILLHYDLENYSLVESLCRSHIRLIKKEKLDLPMERLVVQHVRKLINSPLSERSDVFKQFRDDLSQLKDQLDSGSPLGMDELFLWLESKTDNKLIATVVRDQITRSNEVVNPV